MSSRYDFTDVDHLRRLFSGHHGHPPTCLVRAPGRINLMGDHIDYNGLPVFPMAIQHEILLLMRPRDDTEVRMVNTDPAFEPVTFTLSTAVEPHPPGHWANYAKAAGQALVRACGPLTGFDALVRGTIPRAAGLSSSSALVVAAALALGEANDLQIERRALMALLADAEHYVGTRGGGMDQAVCLGARRGAATRIGFRPLDLSPVDVPREWRFVVAFSGVQAHKSASAREVYNQRTRECADALAILADEARLGPEARTWTALLEQEPAGDLLARLADALDPPLDRRVRHVITEAVRVEAAARAMSRRQAEAFGRLMTASHRSLRDDYEVSCPELDTLVAIAESAGAFGARLTGAGFGGCVVALADAETGETVSTRWTTEFCQPRGLIDAVFVAEASEGAEVQVLRRAL